MMPTPYITREATDEAYSDLNEQDGTQEARTRLDCLAANWERRAQVKQDELKPEAFLDDQRPDFLLELLPFQDHPAFLAAPEVIRHLILSCGWLAYNEKTVDIEAHIISPACLHIVSGEVPGLRDWVSQQLASETLVDEAYHTLLMRNASHITRTQRSIEGLPIPTSALVTKMRQAQSRYSEAWQKILMQLATAIVSEVFISDYLAWLSEEETIQPFNRLTVARHRRDELAHSSIFRNFARCVYAALSVKERAFFLDILPQPVRWFANLEWNVWQVMLHHIGFSQTEMVINECRYQNEENLARLDYAAIIALAEEFDMGPEQRGLESFAREGLLDKPVLAGVS